MPDPIPGSKMSLLPRDLIQRVAGGIKGMFGNPANGGTTQAAQGHIERREPWFGPGRPMETMAPSRDVAGRQFDYQYGINLNIQPRAYEGIDFWMLRALARFDQVRLAIETRKDQMSGLTGSVMPCKKTADELRSNPDARCQEIMDFLKYPDKRHSWDVWMRTLVGEQLEIDAACIYIRRTNGGKPFALELVAGDHITPKIDTTGREPMPPDIAYQQVLKGMPAINYTTDELIYMPRNPSLGRLYGFSPVEQIITTVNIAIRREVQKLNYFTEGNIPEALVSVPKEWTPSQVREFQEVWDNYFLSQRNRDGKIKFVPGGMTFQPTRSDANLFGEFDEWLARIVCYAFSLPSLPFIKLQNRATAETANEAALEEGLGPMMIWLKSVMDRIIQRVWGYADLEWVWDDIESIDPAEEAERNIQMVQFGLKSGDEVRAEMGLPPIGMPHMIWGVGPMGIMPVSQIATLLQSGAFLPPPPAPPGMMPGAPGLPPPDPGTPLIGDNGGPPMDDAGDGGGPSTTPELLDSALANIPPELLAAVGLGPGGAAARKVDVTSAQDLESDPLRGAVAHPQVLRTLRAAQRRQPKKARK